MLSTVYLYIPPVRNISYYRVELFDLQAVPVNRVLVRNYVSTEIRVGENDGSLHANGVMLLLGDGRLFF
jgi:hypothetical protein